ncbi:hypothetical protein TanjilG_18674 [Lupinus angustifolius]|uniref:Amine oxidase domain-containing protein n=1 Tax=Lupinus angustifolius TaxID=3871 RepID=A0A1J7HA62_LUPAN|nr:hypothetical protein TanjilG_18674 [Lupinus angustifolius]
MGSISKAIGNAAMEAGAQVITNAEVVLADGIEVHSSVVLSNATPYRTFVELVSDNVLPVDFVRAIKNPDYSSVSILLFGKYLLKQATTKINVAVDKLPQFQSCKLDHPHAGPQHVDTIHIGSESMEEIHSASQHAVNGVPSRRPIMEMTIPSVLDKTISPPGKHVINLFVQYTPYKPLDGDWQDHDYRESFAQKCFTLIDEYAPGFSTSVIGYDMLSPPDLEREIGLKGQTTRLRFEDYIYVEVEHILGAELWGLLDEMPPN